ncbi:MAG: ABC transporter permease [Nanoarchaeota archaeon]
MNSAIFTIWLRNMKRYMRSKSRLIIGIAQPLFFFIALGFGLKSASNNMNYLKFIAPGIISMSVLFTSVFSGIQIIWDKQFGFLKETLIAPVSRISIMIGQTLGGATAAIIQGLFTLIIVFLIGGLSFNFGILIALVFMALVGIAFTSLGLAIASRMNDMQGFPLIMNLLVMPIFVLSGALFPLETAPRILKIIATINPLTYGVEGIRYGLLGSSTINPTISFAVIGSFSLAMILLGGFLFNKIK